MWNGKKWQNKNKKRRNICIEHTKRRSKTQHQTDRQNWEAKQHQTSGRCIIVVKIYLLYNIFPCISNHTLIHQETIGDLFIVARFMIVVELFVVRWSECVDRYSYKSLLHILSFSEVVLRQSKQMKNYSDVVAYASISTKPPMFFAILKINI